MPIDPKRVQAVFLVAVEQTDPAGRAAVLDRECQTDAEMRHRVEALLRANDEPGSFLDRPAVPPGQTVDEVPSNEPADSTGPADPRPAEGVGSIVAGRYKLLEQIGEGGMGAVWVAEQTQPVRRKVALKLIKAGMDSKAVLSRFEAERQALTLMDHPNIAKVLDGGSTEAGRPFFVMEYVKGIPFTQYCDDARLSIAERLALFVPVCQAVQHAHQKGIIHRDLKPSNILICLYDGQPVPKVIDFGLAKAMHQPLTEHTLYTAHGVMMGTPLYMSPGQAEINNLDVDTRTDIYALGVILYELLTGTTPLEKHRFAEAAWQEMLRLIKEEEPQRPSARLSGSATLPSVAAQRHLEPGKLTREVRGELDWIVMKCLEKDRSRRYETANGLARDVERYLADEVVEARPASAGYRLRKLVRHHKGSLLAVSLVMLALMGGIIGTTFGLMEAKNQQAEALAQKKQAETNAAEAKKQEKEAKDQLEISTAVTEFLQNDLLGQAGSKAQADRKFEPDPNLTIREALDRAAAAVGDKFKDRPELEASIRQTVGDAYEEVGQYDKAITQLRRSADIRKAKLGPDHPSTLSTLSNLAEAYQDAGKTTEAISMLEQVRDAQVKKPGPDHPSTLTTLNKLAWAYQAAGRTTEAIPLFERIRDARVKKLGTDHSDTLTTLNDLAGAYNFAGRTTEAISMLEQVRDAEVKKHGPDHPDTLITRSNLALAYQAAGKTTEAIALFDQVRDAHEKRLGPDHPNTLTTLDNLAGAYHDAGKTTEAIALFERVRDARVKKLGSDHPDTLTTLSNLAVVYRVAGKTTEAIALFERVRDAEVKKLGPDHPNTLTTLHNLADANRVAGKTTEAIALFERVRDAEVKKLGPDHPNTLTTLHNLAAAYSDVKQLDKSIPLFEQTLALRRRKLGEVHPDTLKTLANLGLNYRDVGRLAEAIALLEQAHRDGRKHASLGWVGGELVTAYIRAGKSAEASALVKNDLEAARNALSADSPPLAGALALNGSALLELKAWPEAEQVLRECLAIREKKEPDGWTTFNTKSLLGGALLGQKKYPDAEPLLLAGYEGMKKRENQISPQFKQIRLTEALERLVQLYDTQDKKDEAAKWRKQLEARNEAEKKP